MFHRSGQMSVTWKRGLDKRGLGKQSFLQKSLENIEKQLNICEISYKIYAKSNRRRLRRRPKGAALRAAPLGCCFWHICCIIFHICLAVFLCFPMIFAEKIVFPGCFCPGCFSRLPNDAFFRFFPLKMQARRWTWRCHIVSSYCLTLSHCHDIDRSGNLAARSAERTRLVHLLLDRNQFLDRNQLLDKNQVLGKSQ